MIRPASADREIDIRPRLEDMLRASASWMARECHLGTGSRIDLAAIVGGEVLGFEIKSNADSLKRLTPPTGFQVHEFSLLYDRVTLVCAARHVDPAKALVPPWWGIMAAEDLSEIRPAGLNPAPALKRLAGLLWSSELRALARSLSLPVRGGDKRHLASLFRPSHEAAMRSALLAALHVRRPSTIRPQTVNGGRSAASAAANEPEAETKMAQVERMTETENLVRRLALVLWPDAVVEALESGGRLSITISGTETPLRAHLPQVGAAGSKAGAWRKVLSELRRIANDSIRSAEQRADGCRDEAMRHSRRAAEIRSTLSGDGGRPAAPPDGGDPRAATDAASHGGGEDVESLRSELKRMREREDHFSAMLRVADGGRYRNDWAGAMNRLLAERDGSMAALADAANGPVTCGGCACLATRQRGHELACDAHAVGGEWSDLPHAETIRSALAFASKGGAG